MDPVGAVAGASSETRFSFSVTDQRLRRGEYVKVAHEEGLALAQVKAITREKDGLLAVAGVLGARDGRGLLVVPKTPFRPGDKVWVADDRLIGDVLGLGEGQGGDTSAYLGLLRAHGIRVHLDIDLLVQKHVSVMAKTGAGKSYVVGVLIEELLKRQVPVIIVDPHGEYTSLAQPNNSASETQGMRRFSVRPRSFADRIMEYSPDTRVNADAQALRVDGTNLGMHDLTDMMGGKVSSVQLGMLHQAIKDVAARRKKGYTLADIIAEVGKNESNAKWTLLGALQYLEGLGLFADQGTPVPSLVKRGQVSVINLRGSPPEVQEIVVSWLCKSLFEARKLNQVPPLMLVVEEAHHFCPERGFTQARSSDVLRTIASEGRKFGLGLCVVSQRPAKVDKNVLSQANTQIILKVTNPNDLKAIIASVEGLTRDSEDEIQNLPVGTALVSHPRYPMPIQVEIRPRETRHGGKSVSVLEAWGEELDAEEKDGEVPVALPSEAADDDLPDAPLPPHVEAPEEPAPPPPARARAHEPARPLLASTPPSANPGEAPAITDLRALFHHVLREDLARTPDANLAEALSILQGKSATLRGLRVEFPGAAEIEELDRLHRAATTRLRLALEERERQRGFLGRLRGGRR
jgi:DNA helicase HerA-like ATPase